MYSRQQAKRTINLLAAARLILMRGDQLPTDISAKLLAHGIDVGALENRFGQ